MTSSARPLRLSPELWGNIASYLPPQQACHLLIAGSIAQRKDSSCLSTVASPTDLEVRAMMRSYFKQGKKEPAAARMLSLSVRAFFDVNQTADLPIGLIPSVLEGIRNVCKNRFVGWMHPQLEDLLTVAIQHNAQEIVDAFVQSEYCTQMSGDAILKAMALICESECIAPYPWIKHVPFPKYLGLMAIRAVRGARWEYLKDIIKLEGFQNIRIADFKTALNEAIQKKLPKCLQALLESSLIENLPVNFLKEQTTRIKIEPNSPDDYRLNSCYLILMQFFMQLSDNSKRYDDSLWFMRALMNAVIVAAQLGDSASCIKIYRWLQREYKPHIKDQKYFDAELYNLLEQVLNALIRYNQVKCLEQLISDFRFYDILHENAYFYQKAVISAINGHHVMCVKVLCERALSAGANIHDAFGREVITACVTQDEAECLGLILDAINNNRISFGWSSENVFFNKLYSQSRDACKGVFDEFWCKEDVVQRFGSLKL